MSVIFIQMIVNITNVHIYNNMSTMLMNRRQLLKNTCFDSNNIYRNIFIYNQI